jgi:D-alanyl-D-alanine carboxypeptidase
LIRRIFLCLCAHLIAVGSTVAVASDLKGQLQAALDSLQKQYGFPGATAAYVLKDGKVGVAATGVADLESGVPMTVQSRMLSASIGKTFVAATAVALSHEGALDLDAPISRWLGDRPWFRRLPNHATITLRHLLNHTSGIADHVHLASFASELSRKWRSAGNPFSPEDLIRFTLDLPPLFDAGKGWAYSDTGYILIGLVIEKATGRSYYTEITERFLKPLELSLTAPADRRLLPGLAAGYMARGNPFGLPRKTIRSDGTMQWHPGFEWTGGGLVSNSRDLAMWGAALFQERAMSGRYLIDLNESVPVSADSPDIRYGAGVAIYRVGPFGPVYGHGGWIPGYCSSLRFYVDHGITVAFQINTDIGIDDSTPMVRDMEARLAKIVIGAGQGGATPKK